MLLNRGTMFSELLTFYAFLPLIRSVIVTTKYGKLEGLMASYPNASGPFKSVSKFLGVPFASPPIGELRFKAPTPYKEWKPTVRSAKKHGNICWQRRTYEFTIKAFANNFSYSEDCLYLDVYSPNISLRLPVMVYIHGGGYEIGTAIKFPSDILALQGVVVAVIQYRLGPFGFLTTGDSAAPGNLGMLDQVEALKWIKENIWDFGGDPDKVTIFGASAGGSSVSLHLLSPLSKGLFDQAIAESGVDLSPWAIQPTSFGLSYTKMLAQKVDCATRDHRDMVECMRAKKATDILEASSSLIASFRFHDYLPWAPVVDKNFLSDSPQNLRKKGDFNHVPFMISYNSHEGASTLPYMVNYSLGLMESVDNGVKPALFKSFLTKLAHARNSGKEVADLVAEALQFIYTPWPDNNDTYALRSQLVDLIGDYLYFAPSHEVADIHSKVAPVYMYEFAYSRTSGNVSPNWIGVAVKHGDNVGYDFGFPLLPQLSNLTDETDKNVSRFIMAMYVNFATYGDPTPEQACGVTWQRYNASHRAYLRVDANPKMAASFNPRRMAFWNDYYPKLAEVQFGSMKEGVSGACNVDTFGKFLLFQLVIILMLLEM